jgi:hypothetical protein
MGGVKLASVMVMTIRLAVLVALVSLGGSSVVVAGPITGQEQPPTAAPADQASAPSQGSALDTSFTAASLFDPVGTPLLRTAGLHYLQLGVRNKLRHIGGGVDQGSSGYSYFAGGGAPGGGGDGVIGNLMPEIQLGNGDPLSALNPAYIPEPAALLLIAPGIALALRRRARSGQRT